MNEHVLVPIDESDPSDKALDYVFSRHAEDEITVVHVVDLTELMTYGGIEAGMMADFGGLREQQQSRAEELVEAARERALAEGLDVHTEVLVGRPERIIVEYADDHGVDHIVIGSHGRSGASRVLLGSVAEAVARRSSVPVTIVR